MTKEDSLVRKTAVVACFCLVVAGCSQTNGTKDAERLRAFLQKEQSPVSGIEYRVLPPDVIGFSSRYIREVNGMARTVRPDGKVSLPLVGDIYVANLTLQEIAYEVALASRSFYERADITVFMVSYKSRRVYVFGQVARPGPLPWTGSDTLLSVLARTQPTMLAWPERIKVIRGKFPQRGGYLPGSPEALAGEDAKELVIDMTAMVEKGDLSHNILLRPDDVVFVPANPAAKIGLALRQILYPVQPILQAAGVPSELSDSAEVFTDDDDDD